LTPTSWHTFSKFQNEKLLNFGQTRSAFIRAPELPYPLVPYRGLSPGSRSFTLTSVKTAWVGRCFERLKFVLEHAQRISGGILGLLVGDAVGVPYEFHDPAALPPLGSLEPKPPAGFLRAHNGTPPGTWSDDGAHALCLLASLLHCGGLDPDDLGRRLLSWYDWGYLAVDGRVFDCGVQTRRAIARLRNGVPALEAGGTDPDANGNGSLVRALPLALWHRGKDSELVRDACSQSRVTHGHTRAQACCALYVLWARRHLEASLAPWDEAVASLRALWPEASTLRQELELHIRPDSPDVGRGSGYVVDCLRSARDVVAREPTYEAVVKAAISLGNDTDTTACVAGGIAGVRDGSGAIPVRWLDTLRERRLVEPLLEDLLRHTTHDTDVT
jgi:ADP-ribosyl-[dinitrogen reductase] hydrolase